MNLLLLTPIVFFGEVIDDKGAPVGGATVRASFADKWADGKADTKSFTTTDSQGGFQFSGHGLGIVIQVGKDGYYQIPKSTGSFGYSSSIGPIEPHPSSSNRAIFVLQKMGKPIPLFEWEKFFQMPTDGSAVDVDLKRGSVALPNNGDLRVVAVVDDVGHDRNSTFPHYDWRFELSAPAGLSSRQGDLAFSSPSDKPTQTKEIISMAADSKSWSTRATREYFTKTKNGLNVRFKIRVVADNGHFFHIECFVNPDPADSNLEADLANPLPPPN